MAASHSSPSPTESCSLPASGLAKQASQEVDAQDIEPEKAECTWRPAAMAIIRELARENGLVEEGAAPRSSDDGAEALWRCMHWPSELLPMHANVMPSSAAASSGQSLLSKALKQLECVALTNAVSRTTAATRCASLPEACPKPVFSDQLQ